MKEREREREESHTRRRTVREGVRETGNYGRYKIF